MTTKDEALRAAWQPIATAPKDGTRILVFRPAEYDGERRYPEHVAIDRFMEHVWYESRRAQQPTHWMSLPTPPGCAPPAPTDDLAALRAENERLRAALREVRACTSEHGGASRALKVISSALNEGGDHDR